MFAYKTGPTNAKYNLLTKCEKHIDEITISFPFTFIKYSVFPIT